MHVKTLICEVYIVKKISTFILYYFESYLRTKMHRVLRHDDDGEVPLSENFLIFSHLGWSVPKNTLRRRYLTKTEFKHVYNYVLCDCDKLRHFIQ
jgi:hypothetical protein